MTYYIFAWMKEAPNYIVKIDGLEGGMRICRLKEFIIKKIGLKNKFGEFLPANGIHVKLNNTDVNLIGMLTLENQNVVPFSECVVELPVYTDNKQWYSGRICANMNEIKAKSELLAKPTNVVEQFIQDKNSVIMRAIKRVSRAFDSGYRRI